MSQVCGVYAEFCIQIKSTLWATDYGWEVQKIMKNIGSAERYFLTQKVANKDDM